ncbi:uncharacterized protein [Paramormyrops kingsleyae]|uniref:uncharacterized protein isoform X1 n=2 Tax=Paramormyrops kingsleyae TaxID=1676925 RepID=UPI003B978793
MGSNKKKCPNCYQVMPCAKKVCMTCGAAQPQKQRLAKTLQRLDSRKEQWLAKIKKNNNSSAMVDEALIVLEKLSALGYKPLLLIQKRGKRPQVLTPRCHLTEDATTKLAKISGFFEMICLGWKNQEVGQQEEVSPAGEDALQEVEDSVVVGDGLQEVEDSVVVGDGLQEVEDSVVVGDGLQEVEDSVVVGDGLQEVEDSVVVGDGLQEVEDSAMLEDGLQKVLVQLELVAEEEMVTLYLEKVMVKPVEVEEKRLSEEVVEEEQVTMGMKKRKSESRPRRGVLKEKKQRTCTYHRKDPYPFRTVLKKRVRKGISEQLLDWEPCPDCGKEFAPSWQPL